MSGLVPFDDSSSRLNYGRCHAGTGEWPTETDHVFWNDGNNRLVVELNDTGEKLVLRVKDNGPGFPEEPAERESNFIGFEILEALGEYELGGELEYWSEPMTTVELSFQLDDLSD